MGEIEHGIKDEHGYTALCPLCGGWVIVDTKASESDMQEAIRAGLQVKRETVEEMNRHAICRCKEHPDEAAQKLAQECWNAIRPMAHNLMMAGIAIYEEDILDTLAEYLLRALYRQLGARPGGR